MADATNRTLAIQALRELFKLEDSQREDLLTNNRAYSMTLLDLLFKGFVEVDEKYDHILMLSASLHYTVTVSNNMLTDLLEVINASCQANIEVSKMIADIFERNDTPDEMGVAATFQQNANILSAINQGVSAIIRGNRLMQETFTRSPSKGDPDAELIIDGELEEEPDVDRIFAADFREALVFYLNKRATFDSANTLLDSNIDEAALNAALQEWSKNQN